jgi:hypothetical protein
MNNRPSHFHHHEATMLPTLEIPLRKTINGSTASVSPTPRPRRQRVTITLPLSLLERLRNAVYWTGHGPLAGLISDALDDAVTQMEEANGQAFPQRLAPLKRGRPRRTTRHESPPAARTLIQRIQ